jgi:hypothetical protein
MRATMGPTAAIAGIAPGVQSHGIWTGRRQLFVRFAAEAETAVLYTAAMLARHLERTAVASTLHSISLSGRDPLASADLIAETFAQWKTSIPVMLDCDGQRPELIDQVTHSVSMVQITPDVVDGPASERALRTLASAVTAGLDHAVVLSPRDGATDGQMLRFVEQAHSAAPGTKIVIHPLMSPERSSLDARYATLLEQAMFIHHDTVLLMRIPGGVGTR